MCLYVYDSYREKLRRASNSRCKVAKRISDPGLVLRMYFIRPDRRRARGGGETYEAEILRE